jgi:hypothetical protein
MPLPDTFCQASAEQWIPERLHWVTGKMDQKKHNFLEDRDRKLKKYEKMLGSVS